MVLQLGLGWNDHKREGNLIYIAKKLKEQLIFPTFQSWVCAGRECFFTWAFFGAILIQLSSHNRFRHRVIRDTTVVVIVTLVVLVLSGLLGVAITHMLNPRYEYTASSFGNFKEEKNMLKIF